MSTKTFENLGNIYMKNRHNTRKNVSFRRFKSFFGVTPAVCSLIWQMLIGKKPPEAEPKHLLWSLNFLKQYNVEHTRRSIFKADEKTIRKWSWVFIQLLADLNVVCLFL